MGAIGLLSPHTFTSDSTNEMMYGAENILYITMKRMNLHKTVCTLSAHTVPKANGVGVQTNMARLHTCVIDAYHSQTCIRVVFGGIIAVKLSGSRRVEPPQTDRWYSPTYAAVPPRNSNIVIGLHACSTYASPPAVYSPVRLQVS